MFALFILYGENFLDLPAFVLDNKNKNINYHYCLCFASFVIMYFLLPVADLFRLPAAVVPVSSGGQFN